MSTENPLLQALIDNEAFPSVGVALPTAGRWYDGVIAEDADPMNLDVGVMGILAEQNYRDPMLMLSGESIPRILKTVCPSVLKARDLCEIDLEAILLAARLVSYGPTIELHHHCTNLVDKPEKPEEELAEGEEPKMVKAACAEENVLNLDINEHIVRYAPFTDDIINERFTFRLTRVPQAIHLRPLPYDRVIRQIQEGFVQQKRITSMEEVEIDEFVADEAMVKQYAEIMDISEHGMIENIMGAIAGVSAVDADGELGPVVDDRTWVREWVMNLPRDEMDALSEKMNETSRWLQSFSDVTYTCRSCGADQTFRLELDAERLFGSAGDSPAPKKPSPKSKTGARRRKVR